MAFFKPKSIPDYIEIGRRVMLRKWIILGIFTTLTSIIGLVVWKRPAQYTSEALILVQAEKSADFNTNMTKKIDAALRNLVPLLKSRTNLERIIGEYDLYPKDRRKNTPMEYLVGRMRAKIAVVQRGRDSFRVAFTHKNPLTAQLITDHLANIVIEQNQTKELKERREAMERAQQLVEEYDQGIREVGVKIAEFRSKNIDLIQIGESSNPLGPLLQQLELVNSSIEAAQTRRATLSIELGSIPAPVVEVDPAVQGLELELADAQAKLKALGNKYTDVHPDVKKAKADVKTITRKLRIVKSKSKKKTYDPRRGNLRAEISSVAGEIRRLEKERERIKLKIETVEKRNPEAPKALAELREMEREAARLRQQITDAEKDLANAKMLYQIELSERGERFVIQDPANRPIQPTGLGRKVLLGLGGFLALLAGLAIALIMVYFDQTVFNEYELKRVTDLPVLVSIAVYDPLKITSKRERKQKRLERKREKKERALAKRTPPAEG